MIFLYIMLSLIAVPVVLRLAYKRRYTVNGAYLSRPSRDTIREYRSLPTDSKVMGEWELRQTLHALDVTHGGARAVTAHFVRYGYESRTYYFRPRHNGCPGPQCTMGHLAIAEGIRDIKRSLEARKEQMRRAAVAIPFNDAKNITARLRAEQDLINQVTREFLQ